MHYGTMRLVDATDAIDATDTALVGGMAAASTTDKSKVQFGMLLPSGRLALPPALSFIKKAAT